MRSSIFIPKKINVGFKERSDTYTGNLSYIIYFDEKNKLRKEASWNSWRNKEIENVIADNEPTSGFVLNKKAGGYSTGWNHRQTYVRVYDPRGFEFEIDVVNLLYILENTSAIKGKGLEGEFVYGWAGKDLILIPTESPDYIEMQKYNEIVHENTFIKAKELKVGATYLNKDNHKMVYMGKFNTHNYSGTESEKQSFFFYERAYGGFTTMKTMAKKLIAEVSADSAEDFAELFTKLEHSATYSPIDKERDEYVHHTAEEFLKSYGSRTWKRYQNDKFPDHEIPVERKDGGGFRFEIYNPKFENAYSWYHRQDDIDRNGEPRYLKFQYDTAEELVNDLKPKYLRRYLKNGNLYSEDK